MCAADANETIHEAQPSYTLPTTRWPDEPLIVQRSGQAAAVIISLDEYRRFAAWREERAARRAWVLARDPRQNMTADQWETQFAAMDHLAAHFEDVPEEEVSEELTEALASVRAERSAGEPR